MPFHIVTHCYLSDICFSLSFILSYHFPNPSSGFYPPPLPQSNGCKGSSYFKRSILYRIGVTVEEGVETRSCDVIFTVRVQHFVTFTCIPLLSHDGLLLSYIEPTLSVHDWLPSFTSILMLGCRWMKVHTKCSMRNCWEFCVAALKWILFIR